MLTVQYSPPTFYKYYAQTPPTNSMKEFSTMLTSDAIDVLKKTWQRLLDSGQEFDSITRLYDTAGGSRGDRRYIIGEKKNCSGGYGDDMGGEDNRNVLGNTLMRHLKKVTIWVWNKFEDKN